MLFRSLDGRADSPTFADPGIRHIEAGDPQVLAEPAGWQVTTELGGPEVGILLGLGVDRFVSAAVVFAIGLHVGIEAKPTDLHRTDRRALIDGGDADRSGIGAQSTDNTRGDQRSHLPSLFSRQARAELIAPGRISPCGKGGGAFGAGGALFNYAVCR